jgi:GNAT superfamily N-acetyltransferase
LLAWCRPCREHQLPTQLFLQIAQAIGQHRIVTAELVDRDEERLADRMAVHPAPQRHPLAAQLHELLAHVVVQQQARRGGKQGVGHEPDVVLAVGESRLGCSSHSSFSRQSR